MEGDELRKSISLLDGSLISDRLTKRDSFHRGALVSSTYPAPLIVFLFRNRSFLAALSSRFDR